MKERFRILPMKALAGLSLLLGYLPVFLLAGAHFLPEHREMWLLLPGFSLLWGIIGYFLPMKGRIPCAVTGSIALLAAGSFLTAVYGFPAAFVPVVPCIALLMLMAGAWRRPAWEEWPLPVWFAGVLIHLFFQFFRGFAAEAGLTPILDIGFACYLFLGLVMLNRQGLRDSMHGARKAPAPMRRRNQLLLIALFVPAALAACWGLLGEWLDRLWEGIRRMIGAALAWLMSLLENDQMAMTQGPMEVAEQELMGLEVVEGEPSLLSQIIEIVILVLACLIGLAALIFFLWFLGKKLMVLFRWISAYLRRFAASAMEDYVDEAESTLDMDEQAKLLRQKLKKVFTRAHQIPWNELDGRARVRRLYSQYLQKKPQAAGLTAREALMQEKRYSASRADAFAGLYEKARYSCHDVSAGEADELRSKLK